jgi:tetratricopeptide (TPR) repeat protein
MIRPDSGLIIAALAFISLASVDPDYSAGKLAFDKGEYGEAVKFFEKANKRNPSDYKVKFALASVLNTSEALIIYNEIATLTSSPDSIKALAFAKLGNYYYSLKQYVKAVENYGSASKLSGDPGFRHLKALALFANGDLETAKSLWHTLALENNGEGSQMAHYYLGLLNLKQGQYDQAYDNLLKSGNKPQYYWNIAGAAGKLECAVRMGMGEKISIYEKQIPQRNLLLEKEYLEITDEQKGKTDNTVRKVNDSVSADSSDTLYTLQVGSFGSMQNAAALQKRLGNNFKDVTIAPITVADQTFYRVRIGTFKNKELAANFGTDSLSRMGLSYRIVEKK